MRALPIAAALCLAALASAAVSAGTRRPASPFPAGAGQSQVVVACSTCHAPTIITSKHYTEDKWAQVVDQMITRGAKVSDADYEVIVTYLGRSFGVAER
jgi:Flp pilus assembly protein CpaB